jgi:hypothetical protein
LTIQRKAPKKATKKKVAKRRPVKRPSARKRNPAHKAFEMGYEVGKDDIDQMQWELYDIYQGYAANIGWLLKNDKFDTSMSNYQQWMLGYIQAELDNKGDNASDKLKSIFDKIKKDKNYNNPLLGDHSRVLQIISQDNNTDKAVERQLNQGKEYSEFILDNLLKYGYLTKRLTRYELTPKGKVIIKAIKEWRLTPDQYKLMRDIQDYLT